MNSGRNNNWEKYYKSVSNKKPRELLVRVLNYYANDDMPDTPRYAIDLGSGNGPDTIALLKKGWRVLAIDGDEGALEIVKRSASNKVRSNLEVLCSKFEEVTLPQADLINASYSLPFCSPNYFPRLWGEIENSLKIGARFCGVLFGVNDTWATRGDMTFHTKPQITEMLSRFDVEHFEEYDGEGTTATGESKHWHTYSIIGKRVR
ncbi:MAG: class I SAM-dependent methyltransferase [Ignavibacteriales bacterium]